MSDASHLLVADVAQVLLLASGAALCLRRTPDPALTPGQLTVVGGHLRAGESLDAAARRTTEEISGIRIGTDQQEFCGLLHRQEPHGADRITAVFVAQSWAGEPYDAEPDGHEGLFWVPMEKPPPACHSDTVAVFHMLTHGPSYRALNWTTSGGTQ